MIRPYDDTAPGPATMRRWVDVLFATARSAGMDNPVVELRALEVPSGERPDGSPYLHTYSGNFDDIDKLVQQAIHLGDAMHAPGVYVTVNPVRPELLARANNVAPRARRGQSTTDAEIVKRLWILIDLDPVRPSGISSTDEEHLAACERARTIVAWLREHGWPDAVSADSGNGAHVLFRIDLDNNAASLALIEGVLAALAEKFNDEIVKVDRSVGNAARIVRLYGTTARKGSDTIGRPHRRSAILYMPEKLEVVPHAALEAVATMARCETRPMVLAPSGSPGLRADIAAGLASIGVAVVDQKPGRDGGTLYVLSRCPFSTAHQNQSAYIVRHSDGRHSAHCHHDSCGAKQNRWKDLVALLDPHAKIGIGLEAASVWQQPVALAAAPTLPDFPLATLPPWVRDWTEAEAIALQVPIDLPATLVLAVVALTVARKVEIEAKPGHIEPLNIYVLDVLPSGERKSPVLRDATRPVEDYERFETENTAREISKVEASRSLLNARAKKAEAEAKANPDDAVAADAFIAAVLAADAVKVPALPRYIADDATPEALGRLLSEQAGRLGIVAAEGGVLDIVAGRYADGPVCEVLLRGYSGDTHRVDRVSRGAEHVERPALTLALAVQPVVLDAAMNNETFAGRGLLARFFYSLPKSSVGYRDVRAPAVSDEIRTAYHTHVTTLLGVPHNEQPYMLVLDEQARERYYGHAQKIEEMLRPGGRLAAIREWGSKLLGGTVRLAGLLHVADHVDNVDAGLRQQVPAATYERAITIGEYLIEHARIAFGVGGVAALGNAKKILDWIRRDKIATVIERDCRDGSSIPTMDEVRAALDVLGEHHYLREVAPPPSKGRGRPPKNSRWEVNPAVQASTTAQQVPEMRSERQDDPLVEKLVRDLFSSGVDVPPDDDHSTEWHRDLDTTEGDGPQGGWDSVADAACAIDPTSPLAQLVRRSRASS
ncbi:MAG: YfjI family protein [Proteobacteria bacterium]|nr:YfjI family protein [Pseudomonadota bacterium]